MTDKHIEERPLVGLGTIANWFNPPISVSFLRKILQDKRIEYFRLGRQIAIYPSSLRNQLEKNS